MQTKPVARFTKEEAMERLGHEVHSLVEFSGVPIGTRGQVVDIYEITDDSYDVVIQWELSLPHQHRDRFAKDTYRKLLTENVALPLAMGL